MENSATEKQSKSKTSRLSAFIRNTWLAVKSRGKKDAPLQAPSGTDPADPQPGPSHLRSAARQDQTDPQPGPSHLRSAARQDQTDPQPGPSHLGSAAPQDQTDPKPGPSHLGSAVRQGQTDPQPGPSHLGSAARQDQTDPKPGPSHLGSAEEKQTKMKNSCTFFERMCRTVKSAAVLKKAAPLHPQPDTDSADPQPGPSAPEPPASLDMTDLQLDPSFFEPPALLDLTDLLPAPLAIPESPGADSERSEYPRTASFPGPSTLPFSELYEVEEDIGQGYFGTVLKGIRKSDGLQVAIKFITKRETGRFADRYIDVPGVSKPLFAEVALNLLLNRPPLSPYIVHMLDWFEEEDRFILILEYSQPCRDLFRFVLRETLSESQARDLMYQAVLGAKHCLDGGVFHRDIKLDNFVINTATNQVKLIDFGCGEIAKSVCKGQFIGFACPPEYFADFAYEAEPTTVWSLGIMMYRTVCRCQPLRNEHGRLRFDSRVSADFQDLITRCLALDPAERATMEEILQHDWFQQEQMSGVSLESGSMT